MQESDGLFVPSAFTAFLSHLQSRALVPLIFVLPFYRLCISSPSFSLLKFQNIVNIYYNVFVNIILVVTSEKLSISLSLFINNYSFISIQNKFFVISKIFHYFIPMIFYRLNFIKEEEKRRKEKKKIDKTINI